MCVGGTASRAIILTRLGVPVHLHSHVGVDQIGTFVDGMLVREEVDTSSCERMGGQNVTISLSFNGDRAMTTRGTTALPLLGGDAPTYLFADVRGIGTNSEVMSSQRTRRIQVLADAVWNEAGTWDETDLESLPLVDVHAPNEEGTLAYTRTKNVEDATRWFVSFKCDRVVTCGKNGVIACVDGQILHVPVPAVNAVDTAGAGDVFSATLAWARRACHMPWPEALALACVAVTHSMQGIGGPSSAPYAVDLPGT